MPSFPHFTSRRGATLLDSVLALCDRYFSILISILLYLNWYLVPPSVAQHKCNGHSSTDLSAPPQGVMLFPCSQCSPACIFFHYEDFGFHSPNRFEAALWESMLLCYDVHISDWIDFLPRSKLLLNCYQHFLMWISTTVIVFWTIILHCKSVLCTYYSLSGCCILLVVYSLFPLHQQNEF